MIQKSIIKNRLTDNILSQIKRYVSVVFIIALLYSCINEDISECGIDYHIYYNLRVKTDVNEVLQRELYMDIEKDMIDALLPVLLPIYNESVSDLMFSFYNENELYHREEHVINNSKASFTVFLPQNDYINFALANVKTEPLVKLTGMEYADTRRVQQLGGDTIDSHSMGLFRASQEMALTKYSQEFNIDVMMQNSGSVLVLNSNGNDILDYKGYVANTANEFHSLDSIFKKETKQLVRMNRVNSTSLTALYGISFPTEQPTSRNAEDGSYWQLHVYITMANGKTTKNVLGIKKQLLAGDLVIIKGDVDEDGSIKASNPDVGVSVTTDWNSGGIYEPEL